MKKTWLLMICLMIIAGTTGSALAFNSGSTGVDGAFSPTVNTEVQLPESGILNYATVNIPTGVTVTFKKNTTNTPVYMLATGNVTIAGTINVKGSDGVTIAPGHGGPAGFDGGIGAPPDACGGTGSGPGGGKNSTRVTTSPITNGSGGGGGSFSSAGAVGTTSYTTQALGGAAGTTYGNISLLPLIGGSGGGGGCASASASTYFSGGGGGGGGAILIASSGTINLTGTITADGGLCGSGSTYSGSGGGGSGGAIKLMADIIQGNGTLTAVGGSGYAYGTYYGGNGGNGRIRLEANTSQRTAASTPQYSFSAAPVYVFPPSAPSLKIASVGGKAVADNPTGKYSTPDVILSSTMTNPIEVVVQASNIPAGSTVSVSALSELGNSSSVSVILAGTDAASTATAQINLSQNYANVLMATATFTVQASSGDMPIYAGGEKVIKMRVTSVMGDKSWVTYITESGKEVRAGI